MHGPLEAYILRAQQMVDFALKDSAAARLRLASFNTPFHALEVKMSTVSDLMEKRNDKSLAAANATVRSTQGIIIIAGSIALLITGLLAWRIPAYIIAALRNVGASAASAAHGNLIARSTVNGQDEIGELARLASEMQTLVARFKIA